MKIILKSTFLMLIFALNLIFKHFLKYKNNFISVIEINNGLKIQKILLDKSGNNKYYSYNYSDKCINRKKYFKKYLYFFNLKNFDYLKETIMIIGQKSSIGNYFKNYYLKLNYSIWLINGFFDLDLNNKITIDLINCLKIKHIYICYEPLFDSIKKFSISINIFHNYFKSICSLIESLNVNVSYFSFPPFFKNKYEILLKYSRINIFVLPYIISHKKIQLNKIIDIKILRKIAMKEQNISFDLYDDFYISFLDNLDFLSKLLKANFFNKIIYITFKHMTKLSKFICIKEPSNNMNFMYYESIQNKDIISFDNPKILQICFNMIIKKMDIYTKYKSKSSYISLIVPTRNDNYGKKQIERLDNFIASFSKGIKKFPNSRIELIMVDFDSPNGNLVYKQLNISKNLQNRINIVIIDRNQSIAIKKHLHSKDNFLEYVSKNIGSKYSKSKYLIFTNQDIIFPSILFEIISFEEFNENFIYILNRTDISLKNINYNKLIRHYEQGNNFFNKKKFMYYYSIDNKIKIYGPGDFQLVSKKYFEMIDGYLQFPINWGMDWIFLAQSARLLTMGIFFDLGITVFHQSHSYPKRNISQLSNIIKNDILCRGYTKLFNFTFYNKNEYFGFPFMTFRKIKI